MKTSMNDHCSYILGSCEINFFRLNFTAVYAMYMYMYMYMTGIIIHLMSL